MTEQWHRDPASVATGTSAGLHGFGHSGIGLGVGDIERRTIANDLGVRRLGAERLWEERPQGDVASRVGARERRELDLFASDPGQRARVPSQQADSAIHDRVEHRLDIRLRSADDAQNVAGGGLLVQCRGQLPVARLELGEQAHVLDGDDRLVREGLEKPDLVVSERANLTTQNRDGADRRPFAQHGRDEGGSMTRSTLQFSGLRVFGRHLCQQVVHVDRPSIDDRPTRYQTSADRRQIVRVEGPQGPVRGRDPKPRALDSKDLSVIRPEQPRRSLCHPPEHRPEVGGRATDETQNVARSRLLL